MNKNTQLIKTLNAELTRALKSRDYAIELEKKKLPNELGYWQGRCDGLGQAIALANLLENPSS